MGVATYLGSGRRTPAPTKNDKKLPGGRALRELQAAKVLAVEENSGGFLEAVVPTSLGRVEGHPMAAGEPHGVWVRTGPGAVRFNGKQPASPSVRTRTTLTRYLRARLPYVGAPMYTLFGSSLLPLQSAAGNVESRSGCVFCSGDNAL